MGEPCNGLAAEKAAIDEPALVNSDPYGAGWLVKVDATEMGPLLTAAEYATQVGA